MIRINKLTKFFLAYLGLTAFSIPAFAHQHSISGEHQQFVNSMLSSANNANAAILKDRVKLLALDAQYQKSHALSSSETKWLKNLAAEYKAPSTNFNNHATWVELEKRVDVIPPSLALGQSIQESGWGSSYLARDAHNYFGQECGSSRSCYGHTHYRYFGSETAAVQAYMHNLNSNNAYRSVRDTRYAERTQHQKPNSLAMANGLTHYSILKGRYISTIKSVIKNYNLQKYDTNLGNA